MQVMLYHAARYDGRDRTGSPAFFDEALHTQLGYIATLHRTQYQPSNTTVNYQAAPIAHQTLHSQIPKCLRQRSKTHGSAIGAPLVATFAVTPRQRQRRQCWLPSPIAPY
ncbi:hypothetical protein FJTKL_05863 [Diaporthe vaccinii]|uniref:Uncharacterized protein n=1 Tax=Diaporthe vaccinii TaxID=105482 RepID=A0ABR4EYK8_9PEZI